MQRSVHVLCIDAVVRVTKKALGVDQVMSWLIVARGFVVLVENFLCSNRKEEAKTSAENNSNTGVREVITLVVALHESVTLLGLDDECHVVRHDECRRPSTILVQLLSYACLGRYLGILNCCRS